VVKSGWKASLIKARLSLYLFLSNPKNKANSWL
jgi:hypothetical protein